jgi:hypothetical protein
MSITLTKFKIQDVVIDNDWNDPSDLGMIVDTPNDGNDHRFEIFWQDGTHTFERLSGMADFGHVSV